MDNTAFDALTRRASRRDSLLTLGAAGLATFASPFAVDAKKKGSKNKDKKRNRNKKRRTQAPPAPSAPGANPICAVPPDEGFSNSLRFAQTFIAARTGQLAAAQCQVSLLSGGEAITFEIRTLDAAGVPTATVLASATLDDLPSLLGSNHPLPLTGIFDPPAPVSTGVGYALVVTLVEPGAGPAELHLLGAEGDACAGQLFEDTKANGAFIALRDRDILVFASIVV